MRDAHGGELWTEHRGLAKPGGGVHTYSGLRLAGKGPVALCPAVLSGRWRRSYLVVASTVTFFVLSSGIRSIRSTNGSTPAWSGSSFVVKV